MVVGECVLFPSFPQMSDTAGRSAVLCCIISVAAITEWLFPLMCFWASAPIHSSSSFYICNCDSVFFLSTAFCLSVPVFFSLEERNDRRWAFIFVTKWGSWLCVYWPNHFRRKKRIEQTKHAHQARKRLRPNQRGDPLADYIFLECLLCLRYINFFIAADFL
jgi:hypothetical protein